MLIINILMKPSLMSQCLSNVILATTVIELATIESKFTHKNINMFANKYFCV